VSNTAEYNRALVQRGSINFWLTESAIKKWNAKPKLKALRSKRPIDLIIDSTGLSVVGQGQWASAREAGKAG